MNDEIISYLETMKTIKVNSVSDFCLFNLSFLSLDFAITLTLVLRQLCLVMVINSYIEDSHAQNGTILIWIDEYMM